MKKIDFNVKNVMVQLAGTCFWYWNTFYSFLESCGISSSIYKQFGKEGGKYQVMRSVLELLESQQKNDVIMNIAKQFYNLTLLEDGVDRKKAEQLLTEYRNAMGKTLIQDEVDQRENEKRMKEQKSIIEEKQSYRGELLEIKNRFRALLLSREKQSRGYDVEKLFFDLLGLEEFEFKPPYKTNGEQIDGHFRYEKFDYLVEIKWTEAGASQSDLSIFDGKIKGKAQSTRGLFLSINGFDENAVKRYSGNSPRIILMDGQDLFLIFEERISFFDLMKFKTDILVRKGDIYVKYNPRSS